MSAAPAKAHTIIPAPSRIVRIQAAQQDVIVGAVVDITHTVASACAAIAFVAAIILTNL